MSKFKFTIELDSHETFEQYSSTVDGEALFRRKRVVTAYVKAGEDHKWIGMSYDFQQRCCQGGTPAEAVSKALQQVYFCDEPLANGSWS